MLNKSEQISHFKDLPHDEKLARIRGITQVVGDVGGDLNGLSVVMQKFGDYATDEELIEIFSTYMGFVEDYEKNS